jgi:Glycine rich protein/PASTA domain
VALVSLAGPKRIVAVLPFAVAVLLPGAAAAAPTAFSTPGPHTLALSSDAHAYFVSIKAEGGQGGGFAEDGCSGGAGAVEQATFAVRTGPVSIFVAGQGASATADPAGAPGGAGGGGNGGTPGVATAGGAGGGGASSVTAFGQPLVVAGGGGGCGGFSDTDSGFGGNAGEPGGDGSNSTGGGAGTLTAGGIGGFGSSPGDPQAPSGSLGLGGDGGGGLPYNGGGGGGGGGYYGGGGGGGVEPGESEAGGGGGGSSFAATGATGVVSQTGVGLGVGEVTVDSVAACLVPKLKGKVLRKSKTKLRKSDCRVGKVKGKKSGKVKKQNVAPGTILPAGSRVKIKLR